MIKQRLGEIMGVIGAIAVVIASFLWGALQREKKERVAQELEDEKNAREQANKATEALIKGTIDEQNTSNPRNYKFGD